MAVPRSLEMVAVVKSGAAYLPVDPGYPAERVAFMLGDGDPVAVITSSAVEAGLPAVVPQVVLDDPGVAAAVRALGDGDLADAERREPEDFPAGEFSRVLGATSLSFDVSVFEIFGTLAADVYGPTEAKVYVTSWGTGGEVAAVPPIGRPIVNTRVFVLDEGGAGGGGG